MSVEERMKRNFQEIFRNPETRNGYELLDPMTTAAYIVDENQGLHVELSETEVKIR